MEILPIQNKKQWKISPSDAKKYSLQELEATLEKWNKASGGNFYMLDYFHKKIITSESAWILCGHKKTVADTRGFGFFCTDHDQKRITLANQSQLGGF